MTYEDATAFINEDRTATYVAKVNGEFYTLKGSVMKGFLIPTDHIDYFVRF